MTQNLHRQTYESVANEYYDEGRHPTCANFRTASQVFVEDWLPDLARGDRMLEVGAGRSLLAELMPTFGHELRDLTLLDSSWGMLRYSLALHTPRAHLVLGDCHLSPFEDESFELVAAVLGDAYNDAGFWREIHRVLQQGGITLYTTPAFSWAVAFRGPGSMSDAAFSLASGPVVYLPSYILPPEEQVELIESAGLMVKEVVEIPIRRISESRLSPKLLVSRGLDEPVITGFVATRP